MYYSYNIDDKIVKLSEIVEKKISGQFAEFNKTCLFNSAKVLRAFQDNRVGTNDFYEVTGYGYSDAGREKLEKIYAQIYKAEDALVRPQIMSGTHALYLCFSGLLKHGDTFISITGDPYDSLQSIIGISGNSNNSLLSHGVKYEQIELVDDDFDIPKIIERLQKSHVKLVEIQRSRGYSERKSLTIEKIERVIKAIRRVDGNCIIMVDNCYGDFVEKKEPIEVGADLIVGSLIKNTGGGEVKTGGYIVGRKDLVFEVAERFSAPGIGKDLGANLNQLLSFYKGLFNAPVAVKNSLKTMTFASAMLEEVGFSVDPKFNEERTDIIQTITLNSEENLVNFCKGIQYGSPVESYVTPISAPMPGYPDNEVMAGGTFIEGSTIELSADGPVKQPYIAYMQGGLTYEYGKLGIMLAINEILKK